MTFSIEAARNTPIPNTVPSVDGWKEVPLQENGEPLVPLGPFSEYGQIFTSSLYFGEYSDSPYQAGTKLQGTLITQFVRKGVADRLVKAQSLLPNHLRLVVFDAYRPLAVQQALFDHYESTLQQTEIGKKMTPEERRKFTQDYVSLPSTDPKKPSPHNTGGAVDVVIVEVAPHVGNRLQTIENASDDNWQDSYLLEMERGHHLRTGKYLDFGTAIDHGSERAALLYQEENRENPEALKNRRLLYYLMTSVGFQAYRPEWWHFNAPESQMGAKSTDKPLAFYGAAELNHSNLIFENIRRNHYSGITTIFRDQPKVTPGYGVLSESLQSTGDPQKSEYQKAERIGAA